jgi:hypothetical protein
VPESVGKKGRVDVCSVSLSDSVKTSRPAVGRWAGEAGTRAVKSVAIVEGGVGEVRGTVESRRRDDQRARRNDGERREEAGGAVGASVVPASAGDGAPSPEAKRPPVSKQSAESAECPVADRGLNGNSEQNSIVFDPHFEILSLMELKVDLPSCDHCPFHMSHPVRAV